MTVDITNVGVGGKKYTNVEQHEFETSPQAYLTLTTKMVRFFAPHWLAEEIIKSEDALSNIATLIMIADYRWSDKYRSKTGNVRTKRSYRNMCAIWAIRGYYQRRILARKRGENIMSLDFEYDTDDGQGTMLKHLIADGTVGAVDCLISNEDNQDTKEMVTKILGNPKLTDREITFLKERYFDDMSLKEIGKANGVTRERARQILNGALNKLRAEYDEA